MLVLWLFQGVESWAFNGLRINVDSTCTPVTVRIGNSGSNTKTVTGIEGVESCAANAGHPGKRTNNDHTNAGDRFKITYNGGTVSAKRLDSDGGWGMQLEIECCAALRLEVSAGVLAACLSTRVEHMAGAVLAHPVSRTHLHGRRFSALPARVMLPSTRARYKTLVPLCVGTFTHPLQQFKFFKQKKTWDAARKQCHSLGAGWKLATVHGEADNAEMKALAGGGNFWIGYSDHGEKDTGKKGGGSAADNAWSWDKGEDRGAYKGAGDGFYPQDPASSTFTKWGRAEPNDWGSGEDCAHMRNDGFWNDHRCNLNLNFMCSQDKFKFVDIAKTWPEARDHCKAIGPGWSLAVVMDDADNKWVSSMTGHKTAWIGFHDEAVEGEWAWDGYRSSNFGYFKGKYPWNKGEPNNAGKGENCAAVKPTTDQKTVMWNDAACTTQLPFVCSSGKAPPEGLWWRIPVFPSAPHLSLAAGPPSPLPCADWHRLIVHRPPHWCDCRLHGQSGDHWQQRHQHQNDEGAWRRFVRCGRREQGEAPELRQQRLG